MKELIIDRTKWHRGQGGLGSRLLRKDDTMCCLGFYALACNLKPENILGVAFPSRVDKGYCYDDKDHVPATVPGEMRWLLYQEQDPTSLSSQRMTEGVIGRINDDTRISDAEREAKITLHFLAHDVSVTFIN